MLMSKWKFNVDQCKEEVAAAAVGVYDESVELQE